MDAVVCLPGSHEYEFPPPAVKVAGFPAQTVTLPETVATGGEKMITVTVAVSAQAGTEETITE